MKYAYLNIFGLIIVLVVNYLANALPINGLDTGEIAAMYPNEFVPAGITFSIWLVIYLFLIGFCVYPFIVKEAVYLKKIGPLFFITCVFNASWLIAWHHLEVWLSVLIMVGLLVTLILIYKRTHQQKSSNKTEKLLVQKTLII